LNKIKEAIAPFFKPMKVQPGDWLDSFSENGQTFEEYLVCNPTLPTKERHTIYIQPIGNFTATQKRVMQLTDEYMKAFFNLPVKLNEIQPLGNVPAKLKRKNPYEGQLQIRTSYFLDSVLPKMLPDDAAALICFTNEDLYPNDTMNYVFGQAMLQGRVGVWSLKRFGNPDASVKDYNFFLQRTLKVAMHETGHMFSMLHCTKYDCVMSGSNHLEETDRHPIDVCPECMAKIALAMDYEPTIRYQNLSKFWEEQNFKELSQEFQAKEAATAKFNKVFVE
jgi:archaemetzincin